MASRTRWWLRWGTAMLVLAASGSPMAPSWHAIGAARATDFSAEKLFPRPALQPLPAYPDDPVVGSQGVGYLTGAAGVGATGQATYHVPLAVPPGAVGMQPVLSLDYTSGGGNGIAGLGWSLTGVSRLERCNRTLRVDGVVAGVDFDDGDAYCLDGRKLVAVPHPAGTPDEYRTVADPFERIVHVAADDSWQVWHRDGTIATFSPHLAWQHHAVDPDADDPAAATRHEPWRVTLEPLGQVVPMWLLARVEDRRGNAVQYHYASPFAPADGRPSEYWLSEISYTHAPGAVANRRVVFDYEDRPDPEFRYADGVRYEQNRRLSRVTMYAPAKPGGNARRQWDYRLTYGVSPKSGRSVVERIQHCDALDVCTWARNFHWAKPVGEKLTVTSSASDLTPKLLVPACPAIQRPVLFDADGDGLTDVLQLDVTQAGPACNVVPPWHMRWWLFTSRDDYTPHLVQPDLHWQGGQILASRIRTGDVDGDGRDELIVGLNEADPALGENGGRFRYRCYGFDPPAYAPVNCMTTEQKDTSNSGSTTARWNVAEEMRWPLWNLVDVDGDRRLDLVENSRIRLNRGPLNGDALFEATQEPTDLVDFDDAPGGAIAWRWNLYNMGADGTDLDGDGRGELLLVYTPEGHGEVDVDTVAGIEVHEVPNAMPSVKAIGLDDAGAWQKRDVEGLGKGIVPWVKRFFAANAGFAAPTEHIGVHTEVYWTTVMADLNGDGLDDAVLYNDDPDDQAPVGAWMQWNTGRGFAPAHALATQLIPIELARKESGLPQRDYLASTISVVDVNRDGRDDLVVKSAETVASANAADPVEILHKRARLYVSTGTDVTLIDQPFHPGDFWEVGGYTTTQPGNFDGNGHVQFLRRQGEVLQKVDLDAGPPEVIVSVQDEGADHLREIFVYEHWRQPRPADAPCQYPIACPGELGTLVKEWKSAQGRDGDGNVAYRRRQYRFDTPRTDLRGAGFLGFQTVTFTDLDNGSVQVTEHGVPVRLGEFYPYLGLPPTQTTYQPILPEPAGAAPQLPAGPVRVRVTRVDQQPEMRTLYGGKAYFSFANRRITTVTERDDTLSVVAGVPTLGGPLNPQNDALIASITETLDVDDFANATDTVASVQGGETRSTHIDYDNLDCHSGTPGCAQGWLLGLVRRTETTSLGQTRVQGFDYTADGRLSTVHGQPGNADPDLRHTEHYVYDGRGNLIQTAVEAPGVPVRVTNLYYDVDAAFPLQAINALGHVASAWTHPAFGAPLLEQDVNGVIATRRYDGFGRVREFDSPTALDATVDYAAHVDPVDALVGVEVHAASTDGAATVAISDEAGRAWKTIRTGFQGEALHTRTDYNLFGRAVAQWLPGKGKPASHAARATYDTLGRLRETRAPDQVKTTYKHELRLETVIDAAGQSRRVHLDAHGRPVRSEEFLLQPPALPKTLATTYDYGAFDTLLHTTDPTQHVIETTYDLLGRPLAVTDPDAGTRVTAYNGLGEVRQMTMPDGAVLTPFYDDLGRVTDQLDSDGNTHYEWDAALHGIGALAWATSPDGVRQEFGYDGLGRPEVTSWTFSGAGAFDADLQYHYDAFGRPQQLRYPADPSGAPLMVRFDYNAFGYARRVERTALAEGPATWHPVWTALARDERLALASSEFGNGLQTAFQRDPASGLLESVRTGPALAPVTAPARFAVEYEYDELRNVVQRRWPGLNVVEGFTYDSLDRLSRWEASGLGDGGVREYRYDDIGNLRSIWLTNAQNPAGVTEYQAFYGVGSHPNQLSASTLVASTAYDAAGNQTLAGPRQVTFTDHDQPRRVLRNGDATEFRYGPDGMRAEKCGPVPGGGTCTAASPRTHYLGGLYERRAHDGVVDHVYLVPGGNGVVAQVTRTVAAGNTVVESIRYLERDHLGSGNVAFDEAGQAETRIFDPWGKTVLHQGGNAFGTVVHDGYTDHEHEPELDWINMQGRMYDPGQRRMLSADPFVPDALFSQGRNRYSYVSNNPLRFNDPSGFAGADATYGADGVLTFGDDHITGHSDEWYAAQARANPLPCVGPCKNLVPVNPAVAAAEVRFVRPVRMREGEFAGDGAVLHRGDLNQPKEIASIGDAITAPWTGPVVASVDAARRVERITDPSHRYSSDWDAAEDVIGLAIDIVAIAGGARSKSGSSVTGGLGAQKYNPLSGKWRKEYEIAKGVNHQDGEANCGDCSIAGIRRIQGDMGAKADNLTGKGFGNPSHEEVYLHFQTAFGRSGRVEINNPRDIVKYMRAKGAGAVAMLDETAGLSSGGALGHATVVWNDGGIIRFIDFQAESAHVFAPIDNFNTIFGPEGGSATRALIVPLRNNP